jgi:hypothetical protein
MIAPLFHFVALSPFSTKPGPSGNAAKATVLLPGDDSLAARGINDRPACRPPNVAATRHLRPENIRNKTLTD